MCALVGGGGATGGAGRRPEMGESQPRNTQKIPHIRKDLDQSRHLFSATSATSTSSKVVTVSTSERRSRQKTAASALRGISRRRTREGGRAGEAEEIGVGGMVQTQQHNLNSNKPQYLDLGTPPS